MGLKINRNTNALSINTRKLSYALKKYHSALNILVLEKYHSALNILAIEKYYNTHLRVNRLTLVQLPANEKPV